MPRKKTQVPGQIDLPLTAPEPATTKPKRVRKKTETTAKPKTKELEKKAKNPAKDPEPVKNTKKRNKKSALLQTNIPVKKTSSKKMILSILVDTFISKISLTMQPGPKIDSISGA